MSHRSIASAPPRPRLSQARHRLGRHVARVGALAVLGLTATGLGACRANSAAATDGTLAIGVGAIPGSPGYEQVVQGVELAVERLNASGPVRFRVRLPEKSATSAVRVAQGLRDDPSVIAVVGHPESGNTVEVLPIYADAANKGANGVVAISPTASSPRLSGASPWFFRVAPSDADAARDAARWVLDSLGARRAAIIYRNDSYGRDWASTFQTTFAEGAGLVVMREPYLHDVVEWEAYAALLDTLTPDVVLFPGDGADAVALLRTLRAGGVSIPFLGGDGTETMRSAPEAVGARFVSFFDVTRATSPEAGHFLPRYRERFRREPDMFAALSYDAAIVVGRTVIAGARTRAALRIALERVGNGAPSVDGVGGRIAFERNHDIRGRTVGVTRVTGATVETP